MQLKERNWKKTLKWCIGIFIFGIMFGWILFPSLLKKAIRSVSFFFLREICFWVGNFWQKILFQIFQNTALKPNSRIRGMWTNIPFPLDFRVYLFNVTNPNEVMQGRKPKVQEIGPYFFQEKKSKINMKDHEEDDTVTFNAVDTFFFDPSKSEGLTGDEIIMFPHIFLVVSHPFGNYFLSASEKLWVLFRPWQLVWPGIKLQCSQWWKML